MIVRLTLAVLLFMAVPVTASANEDCRFGDNAARIVLCAARNLDPPGGTDKALDVWKCESGFAYEGYHNDPYHGPFQYLRSTFVSQYKTIPDVQRWYKILKNVHNPRSNIITAVAWAARHGWGPWDCV